MRGTNDPFDRMEEMFEQMRRSAMGPWAGQRRPAMGAIDDARPAFGDGRTRDAGVTLEERDGEYVVLADLPGFEREEIDLTFRDGFLTIDGSHEVTDDQAFRQRTVSESVRVPGDVAVDEVSATYRNGVLEVTIPIDEESGDEHRIEIE